MAIAILGYIKRCRVYLSKKLIIILMTEIGQTGKLSVSFISYQEGLC